VRNDGEDLEQEVVEDEIPEDRWKDDKDSWWHDFNLAAEKGDATEMWRLFSDCAER
jgi:hypothetical protein